MKQSAFLDLEKDMNIPGFGEKEIKTKIKNIRLPKRLKKRGIRLLMSKTVLQLLLFWNQHLKEITETANSTAEENEFEVFAKHIALQLKSLPLLLALEAQENIQTYLNKIRRQHLLNTHQPEGYKPSRKCQADIREKIRMKKGAAPTPLVKESRAEISTRMSLCFTSDKFIRMALGESTGRAA